MTASIIALPPRRPRGNQSKVRLDDMRIVPFDRQPPAVTRSGETWHLNGLHMRQVIILRDGPNGAGHQHEGQHQVTVGEFETVRDAAREAVKCAEASLERYRRQSMWFLVGAFAFCVLLWGAALSMVVAVCS